MVRVLPILIWLYCTAMISGRTAFVHRVASLLPSDARIIEIAHISLHNAKTRTLVLWMYAPQRVISRWDSAADSVYGNHWFGPTFLSLVDLSTARLINTVTIHSNQESSDDQGGFAIPFFTYKGFYYVPHPNKDRKGRPLLLHLQDLTGEGIAGQFVLFDHVASGIAAGSVLGYNSHSDIAMQYTVERTQNQFHPVIQRWAVQVFDKKPQRAGYWKFTWEAGHGEWEWIDEEVHFDIQRQLFIQTSTTRPYPGFAKLHCALNTMSLTIFLEGIQNIDPAEVDTEWMQDLISKADPNSIVAAGMTPSFSEMKEPLTLEFQTSTGGTIVIDLSTSSRLATILQVKLRTWCSAN